MKGRSQRYKTRGDQGPLSPGLSPLAVVVTFAYSRALRHIQCAFSRCWIHYRPVSKLRSISSPSHTWKMNLHHLMT